jgi:hypothetical protein
LEGLDDELEKSCFIAIDTEFTGLNDGGSNKLSSLDTPAGSITPIITNIDNAKFFLHGSFVLT